MKDYINWSMSIARTLKREDKGRAVSAVAYATNIILEEYLKQIPLLLMLMKKRGKVELIEGRVRDVVDKALVPLDMVLKKLNLGGDGLKAFIDIGILKRVYYITALGRYFIDMDTVCRMVLMLTLCGWKSRGELLRAMRDFNNWLLKFRRYIEEVEKEKLRHLITTTLTEKERSREVCILE